MNKIILSDQDILGISKWGIQYRELVEKSYAFCPMRLIKVIYKPDPEAVKESRGKVIKNYTHEITYVREGNRLEASYIEYPNVRFKVFYNFNTETGHWDLDGIKIDKEKMKIIKQDSEGFGEFLANNLHIYLFIMALMIFNNEYEEPAEESPKKSLKEGSKSSKKKPQKSREGITYIIKTGSSGEPKIKRKGSHAKPDGQFTVRGHYRHYKTGKISWVHEYEKGKGKEVKDRIYKVNLPK